MKQKIVKRNSMNLYCGNKSNFRLKTYLKLTDLKQKTQFFNAKKNRYRQKMLTVACSILIFLNPGFYADFVACAHIKMLKKINFHLCL